MAYQLMPVRDLSGGVREDLIDTPGQMPENAWAKLRNMDYAYKGCLKSRGGETVFNATAMSSGTSVDLLMRIYAPASGTKTYAIINHPTNNYLYRDSGADTGEMARISGTAADLLTSNLPCGYAVYNAANTTYTFFGNGTNTIQFIQDNTQTYNRLTVTSGTNRKGNLLAVADNMLWVAGDPAAPNTIWATQPGIYLTTPTTDAWFPNQNFAAIQKESNDKITALVSHENELIIGRTKDLWVLIGVYLDWDLRRIDNVGPINQRAIVSSKKYGIFFVSQDGIFWKPTVNTEPVNIGKQIQNTWRGNDWTNAAVGFYARRNYCYFSYATTTGGANNACMVFDAENQRWMGPHDIGAKSFMNFDGAGDTQNFYRGSPSSGVIYKMDTGNQDNGANFTCQWWTKYHDMGNANINKLGRTLKIGMNAATASGAVTPTVELNRGQKTYSFPTVSLKGFSQWGSFMWGRDKWGGGGYNTAALPFHHGAKGREFQLKFSKTDANLLEFYDYAVEFKEEAYRRR